MEFPTGRRNARAAGTGGGCGQVDWGCVVGWFWVDDVVSTRRAQRGGRYLSGSGGRSEGGARKASFSSGVREAREEE